MSPWRFRGRRERARFKLSLPEEVRALTRERYRLSRIQDHEPTAAQIRELAVLNAWYRDAYLPLTRAIEALESEGRKAEAKEFRGRLAEITSEAAARAREARAESTPSRATPSR